MIKLRNRVKEAWSDIDLQLKRRYNLIPNIVETIKSYATHEESVLTQVTEARSNAINATNVKDQGQAENMLSGALKSLFAVAESYPDLKANENFLQLQNELVDTEDKIQSSRRFYNGTVRDFNTKIQQFPASLIAGMFKFIAEEFFEIENEEEKENVKVDFNKDATPKAEEAPAVAIAEEKPEEPTPVTEPVEEPIAEEEKPAEPVEEPIAEEEKPAEPVEEPVTETPAEGAEPVESAEEPTPVTEPVEEPVAEEEKPAEGSEQAEPAEGAEPTESEEEKKEE